jgi:hypothetical protein
MVYIELLAKENLEDEDLFDREPGCHDNLCNSTSRIHDNFAPLLNPCIIELLATL